MTTSHCLLAIAAASCLAIGCGAPTFSVGAPPALSGSDAKPPEVPDAQPKKGEAPSAESAAVTIHKTHDVPDLRGRLIALPRLDGDAAASGRFEETLTLTLVDKGVTRLIPGQALAEVNGVLDRPEGAARGTVKLNARLSSLSLVTQASGADYILYGILQPSAAQNETREVPYEIPDADLKAYRTAYEGFARQLRDSLRRDESSCDAALANYEAAMAEFRKNGGHPGPQEGAPADAMRAQQQYAGFKTSCQARLAALRSRLDSVPSPEKLVSDASHRKTTVTASFSAFNAILKVRQTSNDETFWIGIFDVRAPTAERALQLLSDKVVQELSKSWSDAPPAVEPEKKKKKP